MPKKINIPMDVIARHFHLPIDDAASVLGACVTVLKKTCRKNGTDKTGQFHVVIMLIHVIIIGIKRWPHQRLRYIDRRIRQFMTKVQTDPSVRSELERLRKQRGELLNGLNVGTS